MATQFANQIASRSGNRRSYSAFTTWTRGAAWIITGYAEHAAVRGGFLDPGMQLITKPFTFDLLTAKVREMICAPSD